MDLSFLAPARLLLLLVPVALLVAYVALHARRRRYALRFTTVEMLEEVAPDRPGWRRHLPAAVLLLGVVVAAMAVARPAVAKATVESRRVVVLAIDTSLSMEAVDVQPTRIDAAKAAAAKFLDSVPPGVAVGVVGFDESARELIAPTTNLDAVRRQIDVATLGPGTAIGEAVYVSLDAIERADASGGAADDAGDPASAPGAIVLLSDGETTNGRPNEEAAAEAERRGVKVTTIAFGTDAGTVTDPDTGEQIPVPVNRQALSELADATGGSALEAETASQLAKVYADLGKSVQVGDEQRQEVTDWFAAVALLLLTLAATGSLFWFGRLP
jgi:Ca-activated chloride channel family protein